MGNDGNIGEHLSGGHCADCLLIMLFLIRHSHPVKEARLGTPHPRYFHPSTTRAQQTSPLQNRSNHYYISTHTVHLQLHHQTSST